MIIEGKGFTMRSPEDLTDAQQKVIDGVRKRCEERKKVLNRIRERGKK